MRVNSQPIRSRQTSPHPALPCLIERRLRQPFARPVDPRSETVFADLDVWLRDQDRPLILDAGCGTGASTRELADRHPHCAVLGIDKSAHRLARQPAALPPNCRLARADLVDCWRLAAGAGWQPQRHYLLYPNPWPKPAQLARRWHAHPVLPWILALGGTLELRTNWPVYATEFARAVGLLLGRPLAAGPFEADTPLSPFERKYRDSGQALYACRVQLTPAERNHWLQTTSRAVARNQLVTTNRASGPRRPPPYIP